MKNVYLSLLFITLMISEVHAQIALEGGYNMANMSIKLDKTKLQTSAKKGADFGIAADLCVDQHKHYYFQPCLFYEAGGCAIPPVVAGTSAGTFDVNVYDLHLNIEYKTGEKCGNRFMFGAGPNMSFYTGGSYDIPERALVPRMSGMLKIGTEPRDDIKQRGFGLGLNVGYQFKRHFYFRAFYLTELSNIKSIGDPDNRIKTSAMGLNIGYLFANCRSKKPGIIFSREKRTEHWRGLSKGKYSRRIKLPRYQ